MIAARSHAVERAPSFVIRPLDSRFEHQTAALLGDLRVSLFGVESRLLHSTLVRDALAKRIDCRIALTGTNVRGVVIAAPRSYWISSLVRHPALAIAFLRARFDAARHRRPSGRAAESPEQATGAGTRTGVESGVPPATWAKPRDAWRIVIVGTASDARGHGVGAALYRALMRDRSLVARIAAENEASMRLHAAVGWRLYRDGDVVLAVHVRQAVP